MKRAARPLDRFPLVRTQNPDEMCAALTRIYARPIWHIKAQTKRVDVTLNYHQLNHIGVAYVKYGIDMGGQYPESDFSLQTFPIRGRAEVTIKKFASPLYPGHGLTVSAGRSFATKIDADYEHLVLLINMHGLADKLSAITGRSIGRPLEFQPTMDDAHPAANALRDHVLFLVRMVSESAVPLPKLVLEEFDQTLLVMVLHANRHNYRHLLERAALDLADWQVQRVEEYIEANWRRPITLEDMVEVSGVSTFDLYHSFKKRRGCSPMEFANQVRLAHARELLQRPDATTTVRDAALTCGFADLGRFENDYILAFGESPSTTLSSQQGRPSN